MVLLEQGVNVAAAAAAINIDNIAVLEGDCDTCHILVPLWWKQVGQCKETEINKVQRSSTVKESW